MYKRQGYVWPHAGVDEDRPVTGSHEEAADGQPGHSVPGEEVLVAVRPGVVTEVSGRRPEDPVSEGMDVDVTDQHVSPWGVGCSPNSVTQ